MDDFNGDGKTDFANLFNDGGAASVDVHISTGARLEPQRWATRQGSYAESQEWFVDDFNGDGKAGFANLFNDAGAASIDVRISTGTSLGWQRWATQQGGYWEAQRWFVSDFNGDGKSDFAKVFDDVGSASMDLHLSTGTNLTLQRVSTRQGGFWEAQKWNVGDFNGDGSADFANLYDDAGAATLDVHVVTAPSADLLVSLTNGLGATMAITYKPLTDSSVYSLKDSAATYPVQHIQASLYVVSAIASSNGIGGTNRTTYTYSGAKMHLQGRGFLGFRSMQSTDVQAGTRTTTYFRQDYPYIGLVESSATTPAGGAVR